MKNYDLNKARFIIKNFNGFLKGKVLDIGCNECVMAENLKINNSNYLGIDIDKEALEIASKKGYNVKRIDLSKEYLSSLGNNSFDSFLCLDVLEHIADTEKLIADIKRVVKKNGGGIIALPNDLNLTNLLKCLLLGRSICTRDTIWSPIGHLHIASIRESKLLIKKYFKIVEIYYIGNKYTVPFSNSLGKLLVRLIPRLFSQSIIFKVKN